MTNDKPHSPYAERMKNIFYRIRRRRGRETKPDCGDVPSQSYFEYVKHFNEHMKEKDNNKE